MFVWCQGEGTKEREANGKETKTRTRDGKGKGQAHLLGSLEGELSGDGDGDEVLQERWKAGQKGERTRKERRAEAGGGPTL